MLEDNEPRGRKICQCLNVSPTLRDVVRRGIYLGAGRWSCEEPGTERWDTPWAGERRSGWVSRWATSSPLVLQQCWHIHKNWHQETRASFKHLFPNWESFFVKSISSLKVVSEPSQCFPSPKNILNRDVTQFFDLHLSNHACIYFIQHTCIFTCYWLASLLWWMRKDRCSLLDSNS